MLNARPYPKQLHQLSCSVLATSIATSFQFVIDEQLVVLSRLLSASYRPVGCDVGSLKPTSPDLLWAWARPRTQTHTQTHTPSRILAAAFGRRQSPECAIRCSFPRLNGGKGHATQKQASSSICRRSPDPPLGLCPEKGVAQIGFSFLFPGQAKPPRSRPPPWRHPFAHSLHTNTEKYIFGATLQRTPPRPHSMISAPLYSPTQGVG